MPISEIVLYSERMKEYREMVDITSAQRPRHWNISSGIASVQASVTIDIDKQLSKPLNSFRVSFFSMVSEWYVVP